MKQTEKIEARQIKANNRDSYGEKRKEKMRQ